MSIVLSPEELQALTGYKRPVDQLPKLQEMGFVRAFRTRAGRIILERSHYDAVTEGRFGPEQREEAPRQKAQPNRVAFLARYGK